VGADRMSQTRINNTRQFKQTREKLSESRSERTNTANTIKLQADPVTVYISNFTITHWRTYDNSVCWGTTEGMDDCFIQLCTPWRWASKARNM